MKLIPVLDLQGGVVVRGVAGQRHTYRPLQSLLVDSCVPLEVAEGLSLLCGHRALYIADLDALERDAPDWSTLQDLVQGGFELLVDAGVREPAQACRLIDLGVQRVVVALETATGPDLLSEVLSHLGRERVTFSLDLKEGRPLHRSPLWSADPMTVGMTAIEQGITSLIVLDLSGVGVPGGVPTLPLCRELRERYPDLEFITGGGVRHADDLRALQAAGVDGVLIASALHDGRITHPEVNELRTADEQPRPCGGGG